MKIGDTIWIFDGNHLVYDKAHSGPIYREHFIPMAIVGETSKSWIVGLGDRKVDKKTLHTKAGYGIGQQCYASQQAVEDMVYVHDMRVRLGNTVMRCDIPAVLRAVETLLTEAGEVLL